MKPWKRLREQRRAPDAAEPSEAAPDQPDDAAPQSRHAISPELFDRPLLQFLDTA
jgi:hypothetical protein